MKSFSPLLHVALALSLSLPALAESSADRLTKSTVIDVGSQSQLFIDSLFFDKVQNVQLKLCPPTKTPDPVLRPDRIWENVTLSWFNVMDDGGKYRMWYECYDLDGWVGTDDTSFCYAESSDGIHWTKPELNLFEYKGSRKNNILFRMIGPPGSHSRVHGACVFKDPTAPPEQRYKAVSQGLFDKMGPRPYYVAGMYSADGLRWTRHVDPICKVFADSQYSGLWDPQLKSYVLFGRTFGRGRSIGRSASADFAQFKPLEQVLQTDDRDPPNSDLYNPAVLKYPYAANVYLMFTSLYQHGPDTLDIRLAVSRDGVKWTWPQQSVPYIALGKPGTFDGGSLYMGQGLLKIGNQISLYYSGSPLKHEQAEPEFLRKPGNERLFSRVVSRLDGFAAADAGPQGGFFVTPPLRFAGSVLKLNVQTREGGSVRVGLIDEQGTALKNRSVDDCLPITGDHIDHIVRWKDGPDVGPQAGKPTRLRIEMTNASIYAFRFLETQPPAESPR